MKYTKRSCLTKELNTIELDMGREDFMYALAEWNAGALIQEAFPNLTRDEREFIMTGITTSEWEKAFE